MGEKDSKGLHKLTMTNCLQKVVGVSSKVKTPRRKRFRIRMTVSFIDSNPVKRRYNRTMKVKDGKKVKAIDVVDSMRRVEIGWVFETKLRLPNTPETKAAVEKVNELKWKFTNSQYAEDVKTMEAQGVPGNLFLLPYCTDEEKEQVKQGIVKNGWKTKLVKYDIKERRS